MEEVPAPERPLSFERSRVSWATFDFVQQPPGAIYRYFLLVLLFLLFSFLGWAYFTRVSVLVSAQGPLSNGNGWLDIRVGGGAPLRAGDQIQLQLQRRDEPTLLTARVTEVKSIQSGQRIKTSFLSPAPASYDVNGVVMVQQERLLQAVVRSLLGTRPRGKQ